MFRDKAYDAAVTGELMTARGAVNKTFVLLAILIFGVSMVWAQPLKYMGLAMPSLIIGAILSIVTVFKREWSPVTAPIYAFCEGIVIGWLSAMIESRYPGIAVQAVILTFGVLFCMLGLYQSRIIRVTDRFRTIIMSALGAICLIYIVGLVMSFFGKSIPLIHENGPVGIIFSIVVIGIAAFSLAMDFDFIEQAPQYGAPKYMEWYAAFGLMVTLIWLYIEILKLLAKLRSRD